MGARLVVQGGGQVQQYSRCSTVAVSCETGSGKKWVFTWSCRVADRYSRAASTPKLSATKPTLPARARAASVSGEGLRLSAVGQPAGVGHRVRAPLLSGARHALPRSRFDGHGLNPSKTKPCCCPYAKRT